MLDRVLMAEMEESILSSISQILLVEAKKLSVKDFLEGEKIKWPPHT